MNQIEKIRKSWKGQVDTVLRFPMTIILLVTAVISNMIAIITEEEERYIKLLIAFLLGAALFVVLQLMYERFFTKNFVRWINAAISIIVGAVYYLLIQNTEWKTEVVIRTLVLYFILLIALLWIPVIKSRNNFNESFLAVFKGFFTAVFFYGVLFIGVVLILRATDLLLLNVNEKAFLHSANIIFILMAPIYFLSLLPEYQGKQILEASLTQNDIELNKIHEGIDHKKILPGKFLEALISYVIIPITAVFTVILLLYIVVNIRGDFWKDNLMEPLLVAYSITVILVYLLASTIENMFTKYFRRIFPKVLVPVVLFQTLSSILKIGELGVTYGRYYVIMFGVFATLAGVLFSIVPLKKNGYIAPILLGLSIISILPPLDAFTISKSNQISRLEQVLKKNDMLKGDVITPKRDLTKQEKETIQSSISYLNKMNYTNEITWLSSYTKSMSFEQTFGFQDHNLSGQVYQSFYVSRDYNEPIPITGYDYMIKMNIYSNISKTEITGITKDDKKYTLELDTAKQNDYILLLKDEEGQELIRYPLQEMFQRFAGTSMGKELVSNEEMTFVADNEAAALTMVAEYINQNEWSEGLDQTAEFIAFISIK